ncbi:hypothetical protein [Saccharicrinis sp. GN24d3]|uniref:hypothetical protein n=1 Tax=Saccharicrinis sp. GN24d3 TaxID=3458416 RepID=UPI0040368125
MNSSSVSQVLNSKIKVFNFFAFVFFGGLAALFLYYKILGGVGFAMSTGFFGLTQGIINLILAVLSLGLAYVACKSQRHWIKPVFAMLSILLLGVVFNQLNIWWVKYNEGLFIGGGVLKTLTVDDVLYFTLYYFITAFQLIFALVLALSYTISSILGENHSNYLNRFSLFSILKPFVFSVLCVFAFYHLWN